MRNLKRILKEEGLLKSAGRLSQEEGAATRTLQRMVKRNAARLGWTPIQSLFPGSLRFDSGVGEAAILKEASRFLAKEGFDTRDGESFYKILRETPVGGIGPYSGVEVLKASIHVQPSDQEATFLVHVSASTPPAPFR